MDAYFDSAIIVKLYVQEDTSPDAITLGCRTLDIIHVAAALVLGTTEFVTFDEALT